MTNIEEQLTMPWVSGWGDDQGQIACGGELPERLCWRRLDDLPLSQQTELGYELCMVCSDRLIVHNRNWLKCFDAGGRLWTVRLPYGVVSRSTIVSAGGVVAIGGEKGIAGIRIADGIIAWQHDLDEVSKFTGWRKSATAISGAWSGLAVVNCGPGWALVDIATGEFRSSQKTELLGAISVGGFTTHLSGTKMNFYPVRLSDPSAQWDEVASVGYQNGMALVGQVFMVLGRLACHGWDIASGRRIWTCAIPQKDESDVSRFIINQDQVYHCANRRLRDSRGFRVKVINPTTGVIENVSEVEGTFGTCGSCTPTELIFASGINDKFTVHAMNRSTRTWRMLDGPEFQTGRFDFPYRVLADEDRGLWYFCSQGIFYGSFTPPPEPAVKPKKSDVKKRRSVAKRAGQKSKAKG